MVKGLVYYAVEKAYSSALTYENLPANLKNHVHSVDSEYAWLLISKLYEKVNKKPFSFLSSYECYCFYKVNTKKQKPCMENGRINNSYTII